MTQTGIVAFDLGAESGRAMLATLDDDKLAIEQIHRFANTPQRLPSGYHWNLLDLWANIVEGLERCIAVAKERNIELTSVGIDTWGVDFGFVGRGGGTGQLLGLPFCYRDDSHAVAMDRAIDKVGRRTIYDATGIQFMAPNSLYQLVARYEQEPAMIDSAERLLMVPDLFHWFLSGEQVNEATIASTSQMLDMRTGKWAGGLLNQLGLPTHMLHDTTAPGTTIGTSRIGNIPVVIPATHDTAAAVAAAPGPQTGSWAYLSSGTWSLMGVEIAEPIINDRSFELNITNEGGVAGTIRLLSNIAGLWLVQECRRDLAAAGEEYDYPALTQLAGDAEPFRTLIDTGHGPFAAPGDMRAKIADFATSTDQPVPQTPGQFVRCCLESLALTYRRTLEALEELTGSRIDVLHIVGGGAQNQLLNQMTADALARPCVIGPFEATAIGNALTQRYADLASIRQVVRQSFDLQTVEPRNAGAYQDQVDRFSRIAPS